MSLLSIADELSNLPVGVFAQGAALLVLIFLGRRFLGLYEQQIAAARELSTTNTKLVERIDALLDRLENTTRIHVRREKEHGTPED